MKTKSKPKHSHETRATYRAANKTPQARSQPKQIRLRWAEIEHAAQPIILERDGAPFAVVIRYADYQRLRKERKRRGEETTWARLAADPTFHLPELPIHFEHVEPALGEGIDASKMLIEDRR
jgi:hypothetical protein